MYFCLHCKKVHEIIETDDYVFDTGFRRMPDGTDVSLGLCAATKHLHDNDSKEADS